MPSVVQYKPNADYTGRERSHRVLRKKEMKCCEFTP